MEPPCDVRNENLFKCSRSHDHAHIWWKPANIFFLGTKRLMALKLGIQHRALEYYQCFHMMTMGWPWPFLWQGQICFRMLLHGRKLIQHWVLLYFQVCSNSAYPQHSGGPLVARVVKQAQNWLFINAVCAIYFGVSSKPFAFRIIFRMFRHFSLTVCIKHGFTGTWQTFADISNNALRRFPISWTNVFGKKNPFNRKSFLPFH